MHRNNSNSNNFACGLTSPFLKFHRTDSSFSLFYFPINRYAALVRLPMQGVLLGTKHKENKARSLMSRRRSGCIQIGGLWE